MSEQQAALVVVTGPGSVNQVDRISEIPGHARVRTTWIPTTAPQPDAVSKVIAAAENLRNLDYQRIGLVGCSRGGLLALSALESRPDLWVVYCNLYGGVGFGPTWKHLVRTRIEGIACPVFSGVGALDFHARMTSAALHAALAHWNKQLAARRKVYPGEGHGPNDKMLRDTYNVLVWRLYDAPAPDWW